MEDYSQPEANPGDRPTRRGFLKGEFISDWLNRLWPPETPKKESKAEAAASKIGSLAEMSYLPHDKEPGTPEVSIEIPADVAVEGTARFGGELQRQRQEQQLRRRVVGLKMGASDLQTEQQEIMQKQAAFSQELPAQDTSAPAQEKPSQKIYNPSLPSHPEDRLQAVRERQYKELAITSPEDKPNEIADVVQEAAELNIPIEDMYEHRHERKDESDDVVSTTKVAESPETSAPQAPYAPFHDTPYQTKPTPKPPIQPINKVTPVPASVSLYRQAILGGFWMAVVLVVIGFVLLVLTH